MRKILVISLGAFGLSATGAFAQRDTVEPVLDIGSVRPVQGTVLDKNESRAVFMGSATDSADETNGEEVSGVNRVEYRIAGRGRWRRALLFGRNTASAEFMFSVPVKKGRSIRVYIRVVDGKKNRSDYLGRRITRSRIVIRREAGNPDTGGDGGDMGGDGGDNGGGGGTTVGAPVNG